MLTNQVLNYQILNLQILSYKRQVNVYETDLMGIVHHSNYLRFCEEARVTWCRSNGFLGSDTTGIFNLAVIETKVKHLKPVKFSDVLHFALQVKTVGVRVIFQYKIIVTDQIVCVAEAIHCNLDLNLKVKRLNADLIKIAGEKVWTETWL